MLLYLLVFLLSTILSHMLSFHNNRSKWKNLSLRPSRYLCILIAVFLYVLLLWRCPKNYTCFGIWLLLILLTQPSQQSLLRPWRMITQPIALLLCWWFCSVIEFSLSCGDSWGWRHWVFSHALNTGCYYFLNRSTA